MEKAIAKIGRQNHINHLVNVLPFITFVFGVQCYLMMHFAKNLNVGDFAIYMALSLIGFIATLFYYDKNHHVFLYQNHIHVYFSLTGTNTIIKLEDIQEIIVPKEECNFSTIVLRMKDSKSHVFYFVDYPVHVKKLIEEQRDLSIPLAA